jgi:hypothetical protein
VTAAVSWREHLTVHPAAELLPRMSQAELRELGEDIKLHGLRNPVTIFHADVDHAELLDGINRLDAMEMVGLAVIKDGQIDRELATNVDGNTNPYDYVLSANLHRRHLSPEQRRDLIAKLLKAKPEASNLAIAKQVKADDKTVAKIRADLERRSEIPNVPVRTDSKGRKQPANKMATAVPRESIVAPAQPQADDTKPEAGIEQVGAEVMALAKPGKSRKPAVNARDTGLEQFDALILELIRRTKGAQPQRFCKTAVPNGDLRKFAVFLNELVAKKLAAADDPASSADAMKAQHAALDEPAEEAPPS